MAEDVIVVIVQCLTVIVLMSFLLVGVPLINDALEKVKERKRLRNWDK